MNRDRRIRLGRAVALLSDAANIIHNVLSEEQFSYDNLPENFQEGDRGAAMEEAIDSMEDALEDIRSAEHIISEIDGVM